MSAFSAAILKPSIIMLTPSPAAYDCIKKWEGLRLRAYKPLPTERYYTIGYGHCGPDVGKKQVITLEEAQLLLEIDVNPIARKLAHHAPTLEQHQFDALVSLIYNIGWYNFRYSMTGEYTKELFTRRNPLDVARRIILWTRAGGKVMTGLQLRRVYEANMFLNYDCFTFADGAICEHSC